MSTVVRINTFTHIYVFMSTPRLRSATFYEKGSSFLLLAAISCFIGYMVDQGLVQPDPHECFSRQTMKDNSSLSVIQETNATAYDGIAIESLLKSVIDVAKRKKNAMLRLTALLCCMFLGGCQSLWDVSNRDGLKSDIMSLFMDKVHVFIQPSDYHMVGTTRGAYVKLKLSDKGLAQFLEEKGIFARAIRTPTVPDGAARVRICLSTLHSDSHIEQLLDALTSFRCSHP